MLAGGHGRGGTPGPVPNPEVKPPSADGTAEQSVGEQDAAAQQGAFFHAEGPLARFVSGGGFFCFEAPVILDDRLDTPSKSLRWCGTAYQNVNFSPHKAKTELKKIGERFFFAPKCTPS